MRGGKSQPPPAHEFRTAIEETIADETRRTELLALSDQMIEVDEQLAETVLGARETLDQLIDDYESERARFEEFFAEYESQRAELTGRALDIHVAMKNLMTDEEWSSLRKTAQKVTTAIINQSLAAGAGG
jgi:hypothetical protein